MYAVLALVAFCASYGAPLQPLFAGGMSCCPTGKSSTCCKRTHSAGWVGSAACGGTCACAFPSSAPPVTVASSGGVTFLAASLDAAPVVAAASLSRSYQAFLFQRPPPATV
jgi:hypothetical protein